MFQYCASLLSGLIKPNDESAEVWNVKVIEAELNRLWYHIVIPAGINLKYPVFTRNKGAYGFAIADYFLPSLIVPFDTDVDNPDNRDRIRK